MVGGLKHCIHNNHGLNVILHLCNVVSCKALIFYTIFDFCVSYESARRTIMSGTLSKFNEKSENFENLN